MPFSDISQNDKITFSDTKSYPDCPAIGNAEKERQRALRREQNPDGITDNVSKKKIRQQEKEAAEKAARDYEAKKNPVPESEVKKPLSGDPERPYCRGRAYDPSHYGRKRAAESDAEQTKE